MGGEPLRSGDYGLDGSRLHRLADLRPSQRLALAAHAIGAAGRRA